MATDKTLGKLQVIDRKGRPSLAATSAAETVARLRGEKPPTHPATPSRVVELPANGTALPLLRTWHTPISNNERLLAGWQQWDSDAILLGSTDGLCTCRESASGEVRWQCRLSFPPRWAGQQASVFVIAGEREVVGLRREEGTILWRFMAAETGSFSRKEVRIAQASRRSTSLRGFQLAGGRLFFLQNERRFYALDAVSGAILWDRWAPDGELSLPAPWGCFSTHFHAGSDTVLLQTSGRRFLFDAATGRVIHEGADSSSLWRHPPLLLDERTLCVVQDNRHLISLDSQTGHTVWTQTLPGGTTLSGETPSLVGQGDLLLWVQPVNIGYSLQRLDRHSGKPIWPRPQLLTARKVDTRAWAFDRDAVYGIEDDSLVARTLENGEVLWHQSLPGSTSWRVDRIGDYLVVSPALDGSELVLRFRLPFASVQWDLTSLLLPDTYVSVWYCEPKTGQVVQRLNFRNETPVRSVAVQRRSGEDLRWTLNLRTSSLLASAEGPVCRLASPRSFVAVGGEIWGLATVGRAPP